MDETPLKEAAMKARGMNSANVMVKEPVNTVSTQYSHLKKSETFGLDVTLENGRMD